MKTFKLTLVAWMFIVVNIQSLGQSQFPDIDPKWDRYYNNNPSEIEENYSGMDFIKIIELVNFIPQGSMIKNVELLKKVLLRFEPAALRQMMITGSYYCRVFKHDDYFALYNLYYNKIPKETWDKYCPYLLPLMDLDGVVQLH